MMLKLSYISFLIFCLANFFSPTVKSIFLIVGLVSWLVHALIQRQNLFNEKLKSIGLLCLILVSLDLLEAIFIKKNLVSVLNNILGDYSFFIVILSLVYLVKKKEAFFISIISGSVITSLCILLQIIGLIPSYRSGILGILDQPFTSSGLILISIFVTLEFKKILAAKFEGKKKLISQISFLLMIIQTLAVIALGQVTVWASLLLALLCYFFVAKKISIKKIFFASVLIISTLSIAQVFSPRIERKLKWFTSIEKLTTNKSISCRYEIWKQNLNALRSHVVFGIGKVISYECKIKNESTQLTHMHNIYLQKIVSNGLVGFTIWLTLYLLIIGKLLIKTEYGSFGAALENNLAGLCIMIGLSTEGLLENWWGDSEVLYLMMLVMAIFLNGKIKE